MKTIGMIVPTVDNSFFSSLVCEVEKYMHRQGYLTLVASVNNQAESEKEYLSALASMCQGLICVSGLDRLPEQLLDENFPLVWVDRKPRSVRPIPWVANDDGQAMEEAASRLIAKGCREIILLPGYQGQEESSFRIEGYKKALERHGLPFKAENVLKRKARKSSEAESEELVEQLLKDGRKIDGLITSSDRAAFGVMSALNKVGYYVPEDVRLMSFDNSPFAAIGPASLTAIDRHPERLAAKACEILLAIIANRDQTRSCCSSLQEPENSKDRMQKAVEPIPSTTIVEIELVERTSTR